MASDTKPRIRFRPNLDKPGARPDGTAQAEHLSPAERPNTPLSIDAIIRRTRQSAEKATGQPQRPLASTPPWMLDAIEPHPGDDALEERFRELLLRERALGERERELQEEAMLLQAREQVLLRRETHVADAPVDDSQQRAARDHVALQGEFERLLTRNQALERRIADLEALPSFDHGEDEVPTASPAEGDLALLTEREAFIEESENALFEKAMALQELETHLAQVCDQLRGIALQIGADWEALVGDIVLPHGERDDAASEAVPVRPDEGDDMDDRLPG